MRFPQYDATFVYTGVLMELVKAGLEVPTSIEQAKLAVAGYNELFKETYDESSDSA